MLWDLRNKPHPIPRIAMYTQISSGTYKACTRTSFLSQSRISVYAQSLGGTSYSDVHGGSHSWWVKFILASYRRVHRK